MIRWHLNLACTKNTEVISVQINIYHCCRHYNPSQEAQVRVMTVQPARNKAVIPVVTAVTVVLVLIGCGLNDLQDKYSRYSHLQTCTKGVLALNMKSSEFCCDEPLHQTEWICLAAYDFVNSIMTSVHAFYIPLLPALCTFLVDVLFVGTGGTKSEMESSRIPWGGNFALKLQTFIEKLKYRVGLILYRTVSHLNAPLS